MKATTTIMLKTILQKKKKKVVKISKFRTISLIHVPKKTSICKHLNYRDVDRIIFNAMNYEFIMIGIEKLTGNIRN